MSVYLKNENGIFEKSFEYEKGLCPREEYITDDPSKTIVNILFGPPSNPKDNLKVMLLFFSRQGRHIVCGGTTSNLVAEFLNKPLNTRIPFSTASDIPPIAQIDGVDLVTEGVITMSKVLAYAKDCFSGKKRYADLELKNDGASLMAKMLFYEALEINFFVGLALNPAHQNQNLPIGFHIKKQLVEELSEYLKKMGKKIMVSYF